MRLNAEPSLHPRPRRSLGLLLALAAHVVAILAMVSRPPAAAHRAPEERVATLTLLAAPPPVVDPPPPPVKPAPERPLAPPRPRVVRQEPLPAPRSPPPAPAVAALPVPPAPLRDREADASEWVQSPAADGPSVARRAPSDYAAGVKSRVIAQVIYPSEAHYPAPRGYRGDPRALLRQCTIPYELLVDREGKLVSYELDRCHDDLLDAAAEAAIVKAQPFAPPPAGVEQYRIYGSVNFVRPLLASSTTL